MPLAGRSSALPRVLLLMKSGARDWKAKLGIIPRNPEKSGGSVSLLDVEVLSNSCPECEKRASKNHLSDECLKWWTEHEPRCNKNYQGSSPMMEIEGALRIFRLSKSNNKIHYAKLNVL